MDGGRSGEKTIDPEQLLRGALEKIVFFECRVSQLEAELEGARQAAERARADATTARRRELDLAHALEEERGAHGELDARAGELSERVRLLEAERERLLAGLVERARVDGAPDAAGAPGPEEGGADLAGFIAELRAEIERLRPWQEAAIAAGVRLDGAAPRAPRAHPPAEGVSRIAERFRDGGRVGLTVRDTDRLKDLLPTRSDKVLYERAMDQLGARDPWERIRAARSLEALGSKAAAPLLAAALGREPEAGVKAALLGALARFKEPFAAELADRELRDPRPLVRVAALDALAAVAEGSAGDRLTASLRDESPLVRRRAALLLGFTRGSGAEEALAGALGDADRGVARAAAAALSGRPSARAQNALARALEHEDVTVRRAAAGALARWSGEKVDADAPAHDRRRAARRIAEKLAAMGGGEIRERVLGAAPAALVPDRTAMKPPPPPTAPPTPARTVAVPGVSARPEPLDPAASGGSAQGRPRAAVEAARSRGAVAIATLEGDVPAPASAEDDLDAALLGEVRAALRGRTAPELSSLTGAPLPRIEAALHGLAARGALALRGVRWFQS
jgi:hypothetical protein